MAGKLKAFNALITPIDFHAHNARINKSLHEGRQQAALFELYLSMLAPHTATHYVAEDSIIDDENAYSSIALSSAPKSPLYAGAVDYNNAARIAEYLHESSNPSDYIRWQNNVNPQPYHYAEDMVVFAPELVQNMPYHTQMALRASQLTAINDIAMTTAAIPDVPDTVDTTDLFTVTEASRNLAF